MPVTTQTVTDEPILTVRKDFDPAVGMGVEDFSGTREQVHVAILEDLDWAEGLCGSEVPARVTLNTDRVENPTRYFLVWHMHDGTHQIDTFTLSGDTSKAS